jgi:Ser/Thr protein kinase RdoA (MazF antagonist)
VGTSTTPIGGKIQPPHLVSQALETSFGITDLVPLRRASWNFIFCGIGPGARFFVKVLKPGPEGRLNGAVEIGAQVAHVLARSGAQEIVAPLPNQDGQLVTKANGRYILVFPWVQSTPADECSPPGMNAKIHAAAQLARLHAALGRLDDRITSADALLSYSSPFAYSPAEWVRSTRGLWLSARARVAEREDLVELLHRAEVQARTLIASNSEFFCHAKSDQFVHGDYRPDNVLMATPCPRIIDFDMCHRGNIAEDVAYAALAFSGPRWLVGPREAETVLAVWRAYNEERRLILATELSWPEMSTAMMWTLLKSISLSYKAEQVIGRSAALESICGLVSTNCFSTRR